MFKLTGKRFGNLIKPEELKQHLVKEKPDEYYKVNYSKLTRQDYKKSPEEFVISGLLKKAYGRFVKLDENSGLKKQYNQFCKDNDYRLDKESLYYALSEKNGCSQWQAWQDNQDLFLHNNPEKVKQLKTELKEGIDYHKFVQFIADKQQTLAKQKYNKNGIKIYGDIPISFSPAEQWGHKSVFANNYTYGYYENGRYGDWGSPAPDMDKFPRKRTEIKQVFDNRLTANLLRYDGVRIDAAWEMVNPCLIHWTPQKTTGKMVDKFNDTLIKDIESTAKRIKGDTYSPDMIYMELIGDEDIVKAVHYTKNKFPHTLITGSGDSINGYREKGYKNGKFTVGIGTHDNASLVEISKRVISRKRQDRKLIKREINQLSKNMKVSKNSLRKPDNYRTMKLSELFTSQRQFINVFDIFGSEKYINKWDSTSAQNWVERLPINYEKLYFKNLTENKGLNLPEALFNAMNAKFSKTNDRLEGLKSQLQKFASVLKEEGPLTEKEANKKLGV